MGKKRTDQYNDIDKQSIDRASRNIPTAIEKESFLSDLAYPNNDAMPSDLNIKLNIMPENTIPIVSLHKEKSLAKSAATTLPFTTIIN